MTDKELEELQRRARELARSLWENKVEGKGLRFTVGVDVHLMEPARDKSALDTPPRVYI